MPVKLAYLCSAGALAILLGYPEKVPRGTKQDKFICCPRFPKPRVAQYSGEYYKLLCGSKALEKSIALGNEEFVFLDEGVWGAGVRVESPFPYSLNNLKKCF